MGPRSLNRGNVVRDQALRRSVEWLQWGRGLSTEEMCATPAISLAGGDASMGPRSLNRGNFSKLGKSLGTESCFNGAAVSQPRKYFSAIYCGFISRCFNGAAVSQPRK